MSQSDAALSPFGVKTQGPTINDLPPVARAFLTQHGSVRLYRREEEVQRRRVAPTLASWLLEGRIRACVYLPDGLEQSHGWVMPGELFGVFNLLLPGSVSRMHLLVDTDEARILHFSREVLLEMMMTFPEARVGIAMGLSRRIQQQHDVIDMSGARPLLDRLRAVLVWWSNQYGLPALDGSVELWVSQADLANGVGASRQRVHLELSNLRDLGELDLAYRKVIIRPRFFEKLQLFAD
jgi:CRP/FNR family cyclic AMP-dependent transcriptional regulator